MLELIQRSIILGGLFFCAWNDWKKQQIPLVIPCLAGMLGLILQMVGMNIKLSDCLAGTIVGILCLIISRCTGESIGYGDGVIFLFTGVFLGFWENVNLFLTTLVLSGLIALFLILIKKKGRKDRMPMAPLIFVAYVLNLL